MLPNTDCGEGSPRHAALQQQLVVSTPGHLAASLSVSTCRGLGLPRSLLADLSGCFARTPAADMSQHAGSRPRRYGLRSRVGFCRLQQGSISFAAGRFSKRNSSVPSMRRGKSMNDTRKIRRCVFEPILLRDIYQHDGEWRLFSR
jgi:hypothetical protein